MRLSLAVVAKGHCDPQSFFESLAESGLMEAGEIEVIIAHDAPWSYKEGAPADAVRLHYCPNVGSILKLWGAAISRSRGDYVAVLDIRCPPAAGWFACVMAAVKKESPLFFGPVNPGVAPSDPRIVGYIVEYAQFRSPLEATLTEVPGNNLVCHRSLFDDTQTLTGAGLQKTFMIWRLRRERDLVPLRFDDMIVTYQKPFAFKRYIRRRFLHGRCFAASRHDNAGQPPRWACLGFTPILPLLRTWRIYQAVRRHRDLKTAFFRFLHFVLSSEIAWSAGEFLGYLSGDRECCERLD